MDIFVASGLLVFAELVLIRWLGTQISVFAYLQNVLLVCCFIGFGVGMQVRRLRDSIDGFLVLMTSAALLVSLPVTTEGLNRISVAVSALGRSFVAWNTLQYSDIPLEYIPSIVLGLALILVLMLLVALICLPLGAVLAEQLERSSETPLCNYTMNLLGGLFGVWVFNVLAWLSLPPFVSCLVLVGSCLLVLSRTQGRVRMRTVVLMVALLIVALVGQALETGKLVVWTPYQKLTVRDVTAPPAEMEGQWILVNSNGYQIMLDLRSENLVKRPDLYTLGWEGYTQYDLPFRFNPSGRSALLLGAGSGNDASGAVRAGFEDITAVDIDPVIVKLGAVYHPEAPYAVRGDGTSQVSAVVADARAFLRSTDRTYDVISFGLLDSHTTGQMTNARLDHFVYTRESLRRAASRLSEGGVMTLAFEASKPYISDRMRSMLREVFGREPLALRIPQSPYGFGGVLFVSGAPETIERALSADGQLAAMVKALEYKVPELGTRQVTDDWPYIYLERPIVPPLFAVAALFSLLVLWILSRWFQVSNSFRFASPTDGAFFFLGSGFLLLETTGISRAAIVLGSSWQPTAAIVTGIFLMALAANATVARVNIRSWMPAVLLLVACIFLYFFDFEYLLSLPHETRFLATALMACLPFYFSGLIFSRVFATVQDQSRALSMNLLGSVVGATFQCASLLLGMRSLLIIVGVFYLVALWYVVRAERA